MLSTRKAKRERLRLKMRSKNAPVKFFNDRDDNWFLGGLGGACPLHWGGIGRNHESEKLIIPVCCNSINLFLNASNQKKRCVSFRNESNFCCSSHLPFVNTFGVTTIVLQAKWDARRLENFFCHLKIAFPGSFKICLDEILEIIYCLSIIRNQLHF
jgi:hypothetical protein